MTLQEMNHSMIENPDLKASSPFPSNTFSSDSSTPPTSSTTSTSSTPSASSTSCRSLTPTAPSSSHSDRLSKRIRTSNNAAGTIAESLSYVANSIRSNKDNKTDNAMEMAVMKLQEYANSEVIEDDDFSYALSLLEDPVKARMFNVLGTGKRRDMWLKREVEVKKNQEWLTNKEFERKRKEFL